MKKALLGLVIVAVAGGSAYAYYNYRKGGVKPTVSTVPVSRGDIVDTVGATGTLQAVISVSVGSQVSGNIVWLGADFNSIVHKDQVIAKIDPTLFQGQVSQNTATLANAKAQLGKDQVNLQYQQLTYKRNQDLRGKGIISQDALDASKTAADQAVAQVELDKAQIEQAEAALKQSQTNLEHTIIESPIDGIVTQRTVDVGQTVQASMTAPQLFVIAEDLTKMQVSANLDESDVGRVRPGQDVLFRVDAYPGEEFHGTVAQIRLNPIIVNNVTTYATMINVPNNDYRLKPGMTANLKVQVAQKAGVLRVQNTALRFRPNLDVFAALNQPIPPELQGRGRGGRSGGGNRGGLEAAAPQQPQTAQAGKSGQPSAPAGGSGQPSAPAESPADRQQRQIERFKAMTPDQQREFIARLSDRGVDTSAFQKLMDKSVEAKKPAAPAAPAFVYKPRYGSAQNSETIDSLFAPVPDVNTAGRVWLFVDGQLKPVNVRLGITDGTFTELRSPELQENEEVVTNITGVTSNRTTAVGSGNPLMPQRGGGPGGFGGPPGRGR
jgi:HlyD family secretion protein